MRLVADEDVRISEVGLAGRSSALEMSRIFKSSSNARTFILIADDQSHVIEALRLLLKGEGYRTESANSAGRRSGLYLNPAISIAS